jgi:cytochrome b
VRVWDIPVRVFHWSLVILFGVSWYTGETGGLNEMTWHVWSGYGLLGLLLTRVAWGIFGSTSARFSQFLYGPRAAVGYVSGLIRRKPVHYVGHTPVGGWMIIVTIISLLVQAATGLFANDDLLTEGPLMEWVSKSTSDWLTRIHAWNFNLLLVLAGVHVAAVLCYALMLGEDLVRPMFTGRKRLPPGMDAPAFRFVNPLIALAIGAAVAGGIFALVR